MSHFKQYVNMYTFTSELPGSGEKITFKPVTTGQLKKVLMFETSKDPDIIEKALDEIANECVVSPENFNVEKLWLPDRFYLMLELRKATKGTKYTFQSMCASCSSQTQQTVSLSSIPVVRLETEKKKSPKKVSKLREVTDNIEDTSKPTWNVIKINDNISVRVRFITREMQRNIIDEITAMSTSPLSGSVETDTQKIMRMNTYLTAYAIDEIITPAGIDSNLPIEEIIEFIDNLKEDDIDLITKWFDEHKFGIELKFPVKCLHCGFEETKEIPLENFFF